jgi:hypothetical protein
MYPRSVRIKTFLAFVNPAVNIMTTRLYFSLKCAKLSPNRRPLVDPLSYGLTKGPRNNNHSAVVATMTLFGAANSTSFPS